MATSTGFGGLMLDLAERCHDNQPRQYLRFWGFHWLSNYQCKMPYLDLKINQRTILLLKKYCFVKIFDFTNMSTDWSSGTATIVLSGKIQPMLSDMPPHAKRESGKK